MSQKSRIRASERKSRQARQAGRIVNGIFIALVVLMVVCIALAVIKSY